MGRTETPPKVAHACLRCGRALRGERQTCRGECERAVLAQNAVWTSPRQLAAEVADVGAARCGAT